jgi:hypothetical protein
MSEPVVTQEAHILSMQRGVSLNIRATAEIQWNLWTDANAFPGWELQMGQPSGGSCTRKSDNARATSSGQSRGVK